MDRTCGNCKNYKFMDGACGLIDGLDKFKSVNHTCGSFVAASTPDVDEEPTDPVATDTDQNQLEWMISELDKMIQDCDDD